MQDWQKQLVSLTLTLWYLQRHGDQTLSNLRPLLLPTLTPQVYKAQIGTNLFSPGKTGQPCCSLPGIPPLHLRGHPAL